MLTEKRLAASWCYPPNWCHPVTFLLVTFKAGHSEMNDNFRNMKFEFVVWQVTINILTKKKQDKRKICCSLRCNILIPCIGEGKAKRRCKISCIFCCARCTCHTLHKNSWNPTCCRVMHWNKPLFRNRIKSTKFERILFSTTLLASTCNCFWAARNSPSKVRFKRCSVSRSVLRRLSAPSEY